MWSSLINIQKELKVSSWLAPLNLEDERKEFLENPNHNPQFKYPDLPLDALKDSLRNLATIESSFTDPFATWLFNRKKTELELTLQLLINRGNSEFGSLAAQLYNCTFDPEIISRAKVDASSPLPFESKEHRTPDQIVTGIQDYLNAYGITDWQIQISNQTDFYFRVRANKKTILISQNFNWDFCDFDNMLAHEIDGHVLRGVNATLQPSSLLNSPLPFYIKTEEGLASFLGDYCSTTAEISRKHHALKYLAGHLAVNSSFRDVFGFLVEAGFTPPLAFQRTFRLKRGYEDTSSPGCFTKEAMYYEGMREIKTYLDNGGSVESLYVAKVGLADISHLPSALIDNTKIKIPERLKKYLATTR
ncbi:MAG TPA: tyrosine/phenylalanine carboxypeptidase domain-containing protein [Vitreimonas sp.]|nr:tyrosine/phenylalanine carboxypeptidase domain-containing protein [Vitreimonas sp.]